MKCVKHLENFLLIDKTKKKCKKIFAFATLEVIISLGADRVKIGYWRFLNTDRGEIVPLKHFKIYSLNVCDKLHALHIRQVCCIPIKHQLGM